MAFRSLPPGGDITIYFRPRGHFDGMCMAIEPDMDDAALLPAAVIGWYAHVSCTGSLRCTGTWFSTVGDHKHRCGMWGLHWHDKQLPVDHWRSFVVIPKWYYAHCPLSCIMIHARLYHGGWRTRAEADHLLRDCMQEAGCSWAHAWLTWLLVRTVAHGDWHQRLEAIEGE